MKHDCRGLEISTNSDEAVRAIDHFALELVSLGKDAADILSAAENHRDCALLQALAASLFVFSQPVSDVEGARQYMERAKARLGDVTERERLFIEGVEAGLTGDLEGAVACHERLLARWPRDMVAAKLSEFRLFETGDAPRQLRIMSGIDEANRDLSHLRSMYAFALELNGRRAEAEEVARAALAIDPSSAWAQHCLGHVWAGDSRISEGIAGLEEFAPEWASLGQYIQSHNWFHLAALYLAQLDYGRALRAYHEHIWGFTRDLVVEQTDAILLLWYAELAGMDVGTRWKEIAPHMLKRSREFLFPFLNTLAIYALARGGAPVEGEAALDAMKRFAAPGRRADQGMARSRNPAGRGMPRIRAWRLRAECALTQADSRGNPSRRRQRRAARSLSAVIPDQPGSGRVHVRRQETFLPNTLVGATSRHLRSTGHARFELALRRGVARPA